MRHASFSSSSACGRACVGGRAVWLGPPSHLGVWFSVSVVRPHPEIACAVPPCLPPLPPLRYRNYNKGKGTTPRPHSGGGANLLKNPAACGCWLGMRHAFPNVFCGAGVQLPSHFFYFLCTPTTTSPPPPHPPWLFFGTRLWRARCLLSPKGPPSASPVRLPPVLPSAIDAGTEAAAGCAMRVSARRRRVAGRVWAEGLCGWAPLPILVCGSA